MSVTEPMPVTREERRYLDFTDPTHGLYLSVKLITLAGQRPISAGYSNVHCAHFEGNPEDKVAVKCPLYSSDEDKNKLMDQALEKEITVLKHVRHPSILPFLGLVPHGQWNDPCIVTPWMKNGSLRQYLKTHLDADRLAILEDVAAAVEYLHSGAGLPRTSFIIHGDIHAGNVLISDEGKALLADFGLSKRVLVNEQTSLSLRPVGGPPGLYMAPELRDVPDAPRSRCSDVFAFGMLIYETYAGVRPDAKLRPTRASIPRNMPRRDTIWKVACDCWAHRPSKRPSINDVITMLRRAHPVHREFPSNLILKGVYEAVPGLPRLFANYEIFEISLPRPSLRSIVHTYLPPAAGESEHELVAIKYMRHSDDQRRDKDLVCALRKELTPLIHGAHPNIVRVLGLWRHPQTMCWGIVSDVADKDPLGRYLNVKRSFPELTKILLDIATGLEYLHKRQTGENQFGIAHGDLNPANVLIMADGTGIKAVLGGFGLCEIVDKHGLTSISPHPHGVQGVPAYLGPELYLEDDLGHMACPQVMQTAKYSGRRTVKGDVFAFGMLSFTTLGGDVRRALCGGEAKWNPIIIAISIVEGRRPSRQDLVLVEDHKVYDGDVDKYWPSIEACWQGDAAKRPAIEDVRDKIPHVLQEKP